MTFVTIEAFTFNPANLNYIYENPDESASLMFSDGHWCHVTMKPAEVVLRIHQQLLPCDG